MRFIFNFIIVVFAISANAQSYTSYLTGNSTDIQMTPTFGITLMGGATEDDNASK